MRNDITDRKLAEARREQAQLRLETLIAESPLAIVVYQGFVPVIANKAMAHVFGYEHPREILAWNDIREGLGRHLAPNERRRIENYLTDLAQGRPAPGEFDCKANRLDGAQIGLDVRVFAMKWNDEHGFCAMIADITQQRANEEQIRQMQRLDALGQLTGGVAHDFNNLLTVILGNGEALAANLAADDPRRGWAELVCEAAEMGAGLTNRLLAFARKQALDPRAIDVSRFVAGMSALLGRVLGEQVDIRLLGGERRSTCSPIRRSSKMRSSISVSTPATPCPMAAASPSRPPASSSAPIRPSGPI